MSDNNNLFKKLTDLFRSGPVVRRKIKKFKNKPSTQSSLEVFKKAHNDVYNSTLSAYGSYDRMARYSDFSEMEATPEISSALDIYSEECASPDVEGIVLHIYSDNRMIKKLLNELFYDVLNIDFNLSMWTRNLCKYGDFFLFNDIHPEYGVINTFPIPIAEIEREEGFDPEDPAAVRFRWITQGNRVLENWQVSHFRLLGNDAFLPYGSSVLEGARRVWRQLILIEDAMLVYRVIRSPERRVFYIDVGNIPPENVADYLEQAQTSLKRNAVIDKSTGQVDLRYNPLSVDEDYFLPVRGGESGTKIDTLPGGSNATAIEDVEYIQKKLFAALKIPKAYLGYDEDIGAKATLAQEDIRFSRSIQRIQKTILAELNKLAMIHLYTCGYKDDELLNFELKLSNPSSIAQQQKLELIRTKFDIASAAPEAIVDREWIRKHILDFNDDEIIRIEKGKVKDKISDMKLEGVQLENDSPFSFGDEEAQGQQDDMTGGGMGGGDIGGGDMGGDTGGGGGLEDLFAGDSIKGNIMSEDEIDSLDKDLLDEDDDVSEEERKKINKTKNPVNVSSSIIKPFDRSDINLGKLGNQNTGIHNITTHQNVTKASDIFDSVMPKSPVVSDFIDKQLSYRMNKNLDNMGKKLNIQNKKSMLTENNDNYIVSIDEDDSNKEE
tara:strand:+ start:5094 stop:7085 length:1992 start_codon:yes stop_codon:yes gene_type:complete